MKIKLHLKGMKWILTFIAQRTPALKPVLLFFLDVSISGVFHNSDQASQTKIRQFKWPKWSTLESFSPGSTKILKFFVGVVFKENLI